MQYRFRNPITQKVVIVEASQRIVYANNGWIALGAVAEPEPEPKKKRTKKQNGNME